jgi:hypothetical protein
MDADATGITADPTVYAVGQRGFATPTVIATPTSYSSILLQIPLVAADTRHPLAVDTTRLFLTVRYSMRERRTLRLRLLPIPTTTTTVVLHANSAESPAGLLF